MSNKILLTAGQTSEVPILEDRRIGFDSSENQIIVGNAGRNRKFYDSEYIDSQLEDIAKENDSQLEDIAKEITSQLDNIAKEKVSKSGDTMTGGLIISKQGDGAVLLSLQTDRGWYFRQRGPAGSGTALDLVSTAGTKMFWIMDVTLVNGIGFFADGTAPRMVPMLDNTANIGYASQRFANIYVASGVISTSDEREKENILPISDSIIKFLMSLNPVEFSFRSNGIRTHCGLIAQEVEQALYDNGLNTLDFAGLIISPVTEEIETGEYTEETTTDENGETQTTKVPVMKTEITGSRYGLRYEEFIAPLIKMVQMQQETIENMEERIAKLEAAVNPQ